MIKQRIASANEAPHMRNDHHEKNQEFEKTKTATEKSKMIV
jgi:hypothetical protein